MRHTFTTLLGKTVRLIARARGGGSALPGLFVERIDPDFTRRTLAQLPRGVVLVSGTNGKTTTTKMIVELLEGQGLRVFTNRTGSNFVRGVIAALLGAVDARGRLSADIAVLELDEAHAVHFVRVVPPQYTLLLNIMRDQLDRFGEIDATAELLRTIAAATTTGIVINHDDPRLGAPEFVAGLSAHISYYGVSAELQALFPSDDQLHATTPTRLTTHTNDVTLRAVDGANATIEFDHTPHTVSLALRGLYNIQNATGAIAMTRLIMGDDLKVRQMLDSLAHVTPAFGRGETIMVGDTPCDLVLVKNPAGFRLSLASFDPAGYDTMIAINDQYADGRDMSWLWDVDMSSLAPAGITMVSGVRAYDMALRLQYDEVPITAIEPDLGTALRTFINKNPTSPKRIYCTYTAMLALRRELSLIATVETIS